MGLHGSKPNISVDTIQDAFPSPNPVHEAGLVYKFKRLRDVFDLLRYVENKTDASDYWIKEISDLKKSLEKDLKDILSSQGKEEDELIF